MFNFPEISMIRFPKLFIHSILLMVTLTFLAFFSADIVGWIIGRPIEKSTGYVTFIMIIWIFFALQSEKYKKTV
ncbi:hypothetical protein C7437_11139 [Psychrobacillus insolitus]|uniref:Uncharacterized protein n=1 Tax=Psychrobacillus insolitus TaxID=1461 RepID=A0A2W7MDH8_9BACI|nr:hypothetical protein [Psychrobacillus insolitus]PZX02447.1 hypothetical protein C7437_11139 [Psychrobacillus insolitus]